MDRKRRTKIFIEFANQEVMEMAKEIAENYPIESIQEPKEGLAMIKVRETAQNTLFYLGEVLVTETKVRIGDQIGLGLVKGHREDLSYALAVADAAYALELPQTEKWTRIFEECEKRGMEELAKKRGLIQRTKVDFNMMTD